MTNTVRTIRQILPAQPTLEGAGVKLKRAFGFFEAPHLDPFLLLDDFYSKNSDDYIKGFPWHPHRGIETITYVLTGLIEHGDSMGNTGKISSGDVQWMTAGSGIIHQEMPQITQDSLMWGFQLWLNLPASHKMMDPRYREIVSSQIPVLTRENGVMVRVISGTIDDVTGPVTDVVTQPMFLDVDIPSETEFMLDLPDDHTLLVYVIRGTGCFDPEQSGLTDEQSLVIYEHGSSLQVRAGGDGVRFLLMSGKPIGEPVAWKGPIVMNTEEELETAFKEFREGHFIKHQA